MLVGRGERVMAKKKNPPPQPGGPPYNNVVNILR